MSKGKKLRTGFTTGTAASAGAKAALALLLGGRPPEKVSVTLPNGGEIVINIESCQAASPDSARATVIKDGGDDPDATHKAAICAQVEILGQGRAEEKIEILGGRGVGVVTRPGLDLAVGQPAINPVPRKMIAAAIREAWSQNHGKGAPAVRVTISVPNGLEIAGRTLNPRLGIVGGISILGTNGLVKPFSHEAYTATIESGLKVARAAGLSEIVLTTGRRSEKRAMALRPDLPDTAFIQMADFFCFALEQSAKRGMSRIGLVSFFGKAVKQAQALACTHAHQAPMDLERLAGWLGKAGADHGLAAEVGRANTARHALEVLRGAGRLDLCPLVGQKALSAMRRFAGPVPELWCVVMDYDNSILYEGSLEPGQKESHA